MKETRKQLNNLIKETKDITLIYMGRESHNNPIFVIFAILSYLTRTKNDNLIPNIINSLSYCTGLTHDILVFMTLREVIETDKLKLDNNTASFNIWFRNCSLILASFFKK